MTDDRWERDTLFVVIEEDFRFEPDKEPASSSTDMPAASSPEPAAGEQAVGKGGKVSVERVLLDYGNKDRCSLRGSSSR